MGSENSVEKDCKEALKQIDEKRYTQMLEKEGIEQILKYGIAFQTKKCCVREASCHNLYRMYPKN